MLSGKKYSVYIMTNKYNNVLYTGMTNNINRRVFEHKNKVYNGFTKKYNVNKIIYYEKLNTLEEAMNREKQIKCKSRAKKIELISKYNKEWKDLTDNFWGLFE
jgi:putative endonuclease